MVTIEKNQFLSMEDLMTLLKWKSSKGILSVYVDVKDRDNTASQRWKTIIKTGLNSLTDKHHSDKELEAAIRDAHEDLANFPQELRKRTMVYFRNPETGETFWRSLQLPMDNHFVWMNTAFLRPIVALMDEAPIMGIVILCSETARIMTWRQGFIDEKEVVNIELETGLENDPSAGSGQGKLSGSSADSYKHKEEVQIQKRLIEVAAAVAKLNKDNRWQNIIMMGSPKFTDVVEDNLPPAIQHSVVGILDKNYIKSSLQKIEDVTTELLWNWKRKLEMSQVSELIDIANAGGRALTGVQESIDALEQYRVEKLFFNSDLDISGFMDTNNTLLVDLNDEESEGLVVEPHVIERMIELAFEGNAKILPLDEEAAEKLKSHGGVGVILRY